MIRTYIETGEKCKEEGAAERSCSELTTSFCIIGSGGHGEVSSEGVKLSLGKMGGGGGKVF